MALTQTHAEQQLPGELYASNSPVNTQSVRSIHSTRSLQSIHSLRDIPYVETSYDFDHDTLMGERGSNLSASFLSTPVYSNKVDKSSAISLGIPESPWTINSQNNSPEGFRVNTFRAQDISPGDNINDSGLLGLEQGLQNTQLDGKNEADLRIAAQMAEMVMTTHSCTSTPVKHTSTESPLNQVQVMDEIAKAAGALASMKDNITTWAPTAHFLVVAAGALQRDTSAFAANLRALMNHNNGTMLDPNSFTSQYYQLREAYSSLLTSTDFSNVISSQQNWAQASLPTTKQESSDNTDNNNNGLDTAWDDRQLVDSFMTLLRTSPGFIASAMLEMSTTELIAFCADGDGSALNVLFHGVLGFTPKHRPRLLAEVVKCLACEHDKMLILVGSLLRRFTGLSVGSFSTDAQLKIERFLRRVLANKCDYTDFELVLRSCIPEECQVFLRQILVPLSGSTNAEDELTNAACHHLQEFAKQLLTMPHQFGILNDTYVGERQRVNLENACQELYPNIESLVTTIRAMSPRFLETDPWWQADELIVVKGSDIILMFNCLLPNRLSYGNSGSHTSAPNRNRNDSSDSSGTHTGFPGDGNANSDDEEWCLESIRSDLVPVMQGLSHSTVTRSDGWQIFKVGDDGLVTDLGSDMGLSSENDETSSGPIEAVCHAVARYDCQTVSERIEASRRDAQLRGDYITLLNLQNIGPNVDKSYVEAINRQVALSKYRCGILRRILDKAAKDQRLERERLSNLIAILDAARVHMWYETEVRMGSLYYKSREFLQVLYPKIKDDDESGVQDGYFRGNSNSENVSSNSSTFSGSKSRRLSILSTHSTPDSPFYSKDIFVYPKLNDKEVDNTITFMKRNRVRNIIPAEERFQRALIEVANLARKLLDRDHLASYIAFKRDRHYQNQYAQQQSQAQAGLSKANKRHSHHHRRSSLGLFDFFESSGSSSQQNLSLTLHTTTSTQLLGLSSSHESLRHVSSATIRPSHDLTPSAIGTTNAVTSVANTAMSSTASSKSPAKTCAGSVGPPKWPTIYQVQSLILSDIGKDFMLCGTETDKFMQQIGRMLLEGDGTQYQPLLEDISAATSPESKLLLFDSLIRYARCVAQKKSSTRVSRADLIHELTRSLGREAGSLYCDLQVISTLVDPAVLDTSDSFDDICEAASNVLDFVVVKSMDYAARFLRYYMETTLTKAPKMVMMGINDAVLIWAFCAKNGNREAQQKLSELYKTFPHINVEIRPLTRPSSVIDGMGINAIREAVVTHWLNLASRI